MTTKKQDAELVNKAQLGDKTAFNQLVLKHQQRLLQLINDYVKDPSESLDILQETFIKAYKALKDFQGNSAFYTWIYRIAVNTAKNHLKKNEKQAIQFNLPTQELENISGKKTFLKDELKQKSCDEVLASFEKLPKHLQNILTLREIAGYSYVEISKALNIPVGTVRSRIYRAREKLAHYRNGEK